MYVPYSRSTSLSIAVDWPLTSSVDDQTAIVDNCYRNVQASLLSRVRRMGLQRGSKHKNTNHMYCNFRYAVHVFQGVTSHQQH